MNEAPKNPWLIIGISGGLLLFGLVIILVAALSPPSPEGVTAQFIGALNRHNSDKLANLTVDTAHQQLASIAGEGEPQSKWLDWWQNSSTYFQEFKITDTVIQGNQARVSVLYGPGLFLEMDILLRKEGRHWKVSDAE